jgi:uncharacterized protein YuzE
VARKLNISYDRIGDILYLETVKPSARQETKHLAADILGRINSRTGVLENIEILFFAARAGRRGGLGLPVSAHLRRSRGSKASRR